MSPFVTVIHCSDYCSFQYRSHEVWHLQFCSFSRLLWLLRVFCVSMQIFKLFVLVLWKMPLVFWWSLPWICRLLWVVWLNNSNSSSPWAQYVFPLVCVYFYIFYQCVIVFRVQASYHFGRFILNILCFLWNYFLFFWCMDFVYFLLLYCFNTIAIDAFLFIYLFLLVGG